MFRSGLFFSATIGGTNVARGRLATQGHATLSSTRISMVRASISRTTLGKALIATAFRSELKHRVSEELYILLQARQAEDDGQTGQAEQVKPSSDSA